jgi:galactokinase
LNRGTGNKIPAAFADRYGSDPEVRVRAPGRVNLIGEHIDYAGLPVLPVALDREVALWLRPRADAAVRIASTDPAYGRREFEAGPRIDPGPPGDWGNYVRAAVRSVAVRYGAVNGWDALVESSIPVAAGLSSSSALVVAAGLAATTVAGVDPHPLELAHLMAEAERFVGTRGGGMDQAACLAGEVGCAVRIEFDPLRATSVPIPAGWRFIVADTGVQAHKSGAVRETYNRLRGQAEEALAIVWPAAMPDMPEPSYGALVRGRTAVEIMDLLGLASGVLPGELLPRFRHVVTEAARVGLAERALLGDDPTTFGELMGASHASLTDDLGVSCSELDELVERALGAGAHGARLTGAGMGGCIVALCDEMCAPAVLAALPGAFVAEPSGGASVERPVDLVAP